MKTVRYLVLAVFVLLYWSLPAQNSVEFDYDPAGNRISRTLIFDTGLRSDQGEEEEALAEDISGLTDIINECLIRIYPNPTEGLLRIDIESMPAKETAQIMLYSLSGQLILAQRDITASAELNLGGQSRGVYLLHIWIGEEKREWKIIKK